MGRSAFVQNVITEGGFRLLPILSVKIAVFMGLVLTAISAQGDYNNIDAVTSASGDLKLKSGKAYATEAIVVWSDHYSNGTVHALEWGTSASYGASMNLKPFTRDIDNTDTLKPLTSSTKYYARFHRVYPSKNADITTTFEFTTTASTAVVPFVERRAVTGASKTAHISLFTTNGRKIIELPYSDCCIMKRMDFQYAVIPGLHIVVISDDNYRQPQSSKVMIGKLITTFSGR